MVTEVIREFQKLLGVAGKSRQLGENEAVNVAALHIGEHPFGFRMVFDGFAGNTGQVIHFLDRPAAHGGVGLRAFKVMRGALALGLVLARNANPDADFLR